MCSCVSFGTFTLALGERVWRARNTPRGFIFLWVQTRGGLCAPENYDRRLGASALEGRPHHTADCSQERRPRKFSACSHERALTWLGEKSFKFFFSGKKERRKRLASHSRCAFASASGGKHFPALAAPLHVRVSKVFSTLSPRPQETQPAPR